MKTVLMLLAMMFLIGAPVAAQEKAPAGDKKAEEGKKEEAAVDAYALYKVKGRTWTWKSVSKYSGMETVGYTKYEVLEVTDKDCKCKFTMMDAEKKETYSMEQTIPFTVVETPKDPKAPATPAPEIVEETIKVEAGEFACQKWTSGDDKNKSTSWTSKKYIGLLVKSESKSEAGESAMELVEFKEGEAK